MSILITKRTIYAKEICCIFPKLCVETWSNNTKYVIIY